VKTLLPVFLLRARSFLQLPERSAGAIRLACSAGATWQDLTGRSAGVIRKDDQPERGDSERPND